MEEQQSIKTIIKKGLPKGSYIKIRKKIRDNPDMILPYLSHSDKKKVVKMAMQLKDEDILKQMLDVLSFEEQIEVATYLYKDKLYVPYEACFKKHFSAFLETGLSLGHNALLFHLSHIVSKNPEMHVPRERLKNYFIKQEVDDVFVAVANMSGFQSEEMEDKIFQSRVSFCLEYIIKSDINKVDAKFGKLLSKTLSNKDIENIISEIGSNHVLFVKFLHSLIRQVKDVKVKSRYLLEVFQNLKILDYQDYLIEQLFSLEVVSDIKELLALLDDKVIIKYSRVALETKNTTLGLHLAYLTNTYLTYKLIDMTLNSENDKILYLVSNLNGENLTYALSKLLDMGYQKYLEVLNNIELMGLQNGEEMLDFFLESDLATKINEEVLGNIRKYKEDKYGSKKVSKS